MLSNAIKFSQRFDKILVTLEIQNLVSLEIQDSTIIQEITIEVIDYGIGISQTDQELIFNRYFRTTDQYSRAQNASGHGLGLSISQKIANTIGGSL